MPDPPELAGARAAQTALEAWLEARDPVDPATPSRLPGWSVGHVLTHLARNADSHLRMLAGEPQYPGGAAQREADIAAGADRPWAELVADVCRAQRRLDEAWSSVTDWTQTAPRLAGSRSLGELPFLRWREVAVHRIDLGFGDTFADLPGEYVRRELAGLTMRYRASKPIGMTQLPQAAATAAPPVRLAWLLGRAEIDGLAPAGIF